MVLVLLVLASLLAVPSGVASQANDSFVHPYMLQLYQRTTDLQGNIRPGVQPEDLATWGFLDNFNG